ncbi:MAG TPA: tryptophan--tRNA ligase, partial [Gemmatimonadales bacterium]
FKDKSQRLDSVPAGLLQYPVLQAADILLYRADTVPVGEDQAQHLELTREVARRWNQQFAPDQPFFPEPVALHTEAKRILGLDGQAKMSKSLGNTIAITESAEEIWQKLRPAVTDPARVKRTDPGEPLKCPVIYQLHRHFSPPDVVELVEHNCRGAGWGCLDCKRVLADHMVAVLAPMRERVLALREQPEQVDRILADGAERARAIARETLRVAKDRMGFLGGRT